MARPELSSSFLVQGDPLTGFFQDRGPEFLRRRAAARRAGNPYLQQARTRQPGLDTMLARTASQQRQARAAETNRLDPEIMTNAAFRALMEYVAETQPELRTFVVAARQRHEASPEGPLRDSDLRLMAERAKVHGLSRAATTLTGLLSLARSGELRRIVAGEQTPAVRQAVWTKLHRYGKTQYAPGDLAVHRPTGKRATVLDYLPDSKEYVVSLGEFEMATCKAGDLFRSAEKSRQKVAEEKRRAERERQITSLRVEPKDRTDVVSRMAQISELPQRVMQKAQQILAGVNCVMAPTLRFVGFSDVRHAADNSVVSATARVQVIFPTDLGPRVEVLLPIPVIQGQVKSPTYFLMHGKARPCTPEGFEKALLGFHLAPRPRHYRPYNLPAMAYLPDTNVRSMWAPVRPLPRDLPGSGGIQPSLG